MVHNGNNQFKYGAAFLIFIYWSLQAGLWFYIADTISSFCKRNQCGIYSFFAVWLICTAGYFLWLWQGVWLVFGHWQGDLLTFPLVPLATFCPLLTALPFFTAPGLLLILLLFNCLSALLVVERSFLVGSGLLLSLLPFVGGYFCAPVKESTPAWLHEISYISPQGITCTNALDAAQEIAERALAIMGKRPYTRLVVMPESSYPWALNERPEIVALWANTVFFDRTLLCIGAHKKAAGKNFNALFFISSAGIIMDYVKRNLVPVAEEIPWWAKNIRNLKELFFKNGEGFCPREHSAHFIDTGGFLFKPLLCSEVFLGRCMEQLSCNATYMACMNDNIMPGKSGLFIKKLMQLLAVYRAIEYQTPILYVGHGEAFYIHRNGLKVPLV